MNRSAYCGNDPVNWVDPSGNLSQSVWSNWSQSQKNVYDYLYDRWSINYALALQQNYDYGDYNNGVKYEDIVDYVNGTKNNSTVEKWAKEYGVLLIPNDTYKTMVQTAGDYKQREENKKATDEAYKIVNDAVNSIGKSGEIATAAVISVNADGAAINGVNSFFSYFWPALGESIEFEWAIGTGVGLKKQIGPVKTEVSAIWVRQTHTYSARGYEQWLGGSFGIKAELWEDKAGVGANLSPGYGFHNNQHTVGGYIGRYDIGINNSADSDWVFSVGAGGYVAVGGEISIGINISQLRRSMGW